MNRFQLADIIYFEYLGEVRVGTIFEIRHSGYRVSFYSLSGREFFVSKEDAFKTLEDWARNLIESKSVGASSNMKRFWISWYSYSDDVPDNDEMFRWWTSGSTWVNGKGARAICAIVDAKSENEAWDKVSEHFNVVEKRFCIERDLNWKSNNRFR